MLRLTLCLLTVSGTYASPTGGGHHSGGGQQQQHHGQARRAHAAEISTNCSAWIEAIRKAGHRDCCHPSQWKSSSSIYSQGDQDGILREIFAGLGITTPARAVEFGYGYVPSAENLTGTAFVDAIRAANWPNTRLLQEHGWNVTYFDALLASAPESGIHIVKAVLTEDNIVGHFRAAGVPTDVEYVSIDVDSVEVWLLRALLRGGYRPRVLSVEFNANLPATSLLAHQREWHEWTEHSIYGSSAGAINLVASMFGYRVVHVMKFLDMFFVREEDLERCLPGSLPSFEEATSHNFGPLPRRMLPTCTRSDAKRFVDVALELNGQHDLARAKAIAELTQIDADYKEQFAQSRWGALCDLTKE